MTITLHLLKSIFERMELEKLSQMNITEKTLPEQNIIGIQIRTSNAEAMETIGAHWGKFYSESIKDKIPNKSGDDVIALYSNYEGDYTKPYDFTIGCRVSDTSDIPDGMTAKRIPASKFTMFTAKGKMPGCIVDTWQKIWNSGIERTYTGDYEVYDKRSANPADCELDIFIAVK